MALTTFKLEEELASMPSKEREAFLSSVRSLSGYIPSVKLCKKLTSLKELCIHAQTKDLTKEDWKALSLLTNLRSLDLDNIHFTPSSLEALRTFTQITSLKLRSYCRLGAQRIGSLSLLSLTSLKVNLEHIVSDEAFWSGLPSTLRILTINNRAFLSYSLPPSAISCISRIPYLFLNCRFEGKVASLVSEHRKILLYSYFVPLDIEDCVSLTTSKSLTSLNLRVKEGLSQEALDLLTTKSPCLNILNLTLPKANNNPILSLKVGPMMERISLLNAPVEFLDQSISDSDRLVTLNITNGILTDSGIEALASNTTLTSLDLRSNRLSEHCLGYLASHPELTNLSLSGNSIANYQALDSNYQITATKDPEDHPLHNLTTRNIEEQRKEQNHHCSLLSMLLSLYI